MKNTAIFLQGTGVYDWGFILDSQGLPTCILKWDLETRERMAI